MLLVDGVALPAHVIVVDQLGVRRLGSRRVIHEIEEALTTKCACDVGVTDLAGFGLHRFIDDIVGINAGPVPAADGADMLAEQLLRCSGSLPAKVIVREPLGIPLVRRPEERVTAQLEPVARRIIGDRVEGAKIERVRRPPDPLPLQLILRHQQRTFTLEQRGIARIGEAAGVRTRGRPSNSRPEPPPARLGQLVERNEPRSAKGGAGNQRRRGKIVLGTPTDLRRAGVPPLDVSELGPEGYLVRSVNVPTGRIIVVTGNSGAGVLYGAFALIREMQLGHQLDYLNLRSAPA